MFNMTLLLYYFLSIVIISISSLSLGLSGKSAAKLQRFFHSRKLFVQNFVAALPERPGLHRMTAFSKASAKLRPLSVTAKFFRHFFQPKSQTNPQPPVNQHLQNTKKSRSPSNDNDLKKKRYIKYYYMTPRSRRRSCQAHAERIVSSIGVSAFQPRTSFA